MFGASVWVQLFRHGLFGASLFGDGLFGAIGIHHPTIWKLIDGLHKMQKGRDAYYEKLLAGHQPPQKLKKYKDADRRIHETVLRCENMGTVEYLKSLAHNYQMN